MEAPALGCGALSAALFQQTPFAPALVAPPPFAPGPAQVPDEIVYERDLDRRRGRPKIMPWPQAADGRQRGKLHHNTHGAHCVELAPANQHVHGSGSRRYSSAVCRAAVINAIAVMPAVAITPPTSNSSQVLPKRREYGLCSRARLPITSRIRISVGPKYACDISKHPSVCVAR